MALAKWRCWGDMGTSLSKISCKQKDTAAVIPATIPKRMWNTITSQASKRGHANYDSHGEVGSAPRSSYGHMQRECSLSFEQKVSSCGEEIQRNWSLQELFGVEDSLGNDFPSTLLNCGSRKEPWSQQSSIQEIFQIPADSSGRSADQDSVNEAAARSIQRASDHGSDCRMKACQPSESKSADSMPLDPQLGEDGLEGVGLTLDDIILLYENNEFEEEDVVPFINTTCPGNRFEVSNMLGTIGLSTGEL